VLGAVNKDEFSVHIKIAVQKQINPRSESAVPIDFILGLRFPIILVIFESKE